MSERISWDELRETLGVVPDHPAYRAARAEFELAVEARRPREVRDPPLNEPPG
ncbi:hypothetical protein GCM10029964_113200 [Kibdelosporangium lantanae]